MTDEPPMKAFASLIQRHLDERGWTLDDLARALAPQQWQSSRRKIDNLLGGGDIRNQLIDPISRELGLSPGERAAALQSDRRDWCRWRAEGQRARFSPHFWIEVSNVWRPVPLMTSGPRRTVAVPVELLGLDEEPAILREAGAFIAGHFGSSDCRVEREHVNHYVYRPQFDRGYRFTPQGALVERIDGLYLGSVSRNPDP